MLSSRQQFLDLVRYLIEIAEGGPERAKQLQPMASQFALARVHEKQIDHSGILRDLDAKSFERGEAIYLRLCINCHGTKDQAGSLPMSLKFAEGKFKNGHDPFRMYQTLTHEAWNDGSPVLDGTTAKIRCDSLHPRDLPEAA